MSMQRAARKKSGGGRPVNRTAARAEEGKAPGAATYPKGLASPALRLPAARVTEQGRVPPAIERQEEPEPAGAAARRSDRRMAVTPADDASEREAQAVADKVARGEKAAAVSPMPAQVSRVAGEEEGEAASAARAQEEEAATARRAGEGEAEPTGPIMPASRRAAGAKGETAEAGRAGGGSAVPSRAARQVEDKEEGGGTVQAAVRRRGRDAAAEEGLDTAAASRAMADSREGRPLDPAIRPTLEKRMGTDLGDVRVHGDEGARRAADALKARAFTAGNDIYMGRGESERDVSLMAHEATHVVQQSGGSAGRRPAQRAGGATTSQNDPERTGEDEPEQTDPDRYVHPEHGTIDRKGDKRAITIPQISLPKFKNVGGDKVPNFEAELWNPPITLPAPGSRDTNQVSKWETAALEGDSLKENLVDKVKSKSKIVDSAGDQLFFLKFKKQKTYVVGLEQEVLPRLARPYWTPQGGFQIYHVDHVKEDQLGGPDDITNMWLLNDRSNTSAGSKIKNEIKNRVTTVASKAVPHLWSEAPSYDSLRQNYKIQFDGIDWTEMGIAGDKSKFYTLKDIKEDSKQLKGLKVLNKTEVEEQGLRGSPEKLLIYTNKTGGGARQLDWGTDAQGEKKTEGWNDFYEGFNLTDVEYTKNEGGCLHGTLFANNKVIKEAQLSMPIKELPAVEYGGYVWRGGLKAKLNKLEADYLSPIELAEVDLLPSGVVYVKGLIQPTLPYLKGSPIEIVIRGDEVEARKTFSSGEIALPKPFVVSNAELTIGLGTEGIIAEGKLDFAIERVGEGELTAKRDQDTGGLLLDGSFSFQSDLFDPAEISVSYKGEEWSGEGKLGIPRGKITGIRSAEVEAEVTADSFTADGRIVPDIPKVEEGTMHVRYSEKDGFAIGGSLSFGEGIPGIQGGKLEAELTKAGESEGWSLSGAGKADVAIAGVTGEIDAAYDDGAFTIHGTAAYERGIAAGEVELGASNRALDDAGQPTGEPTDDLVAFGSGNVTITFTPWLQGEVGLEVEPDGHIIVSGEVGLPSKVEVFAQRKFEKQIFSISIDIPIVGVSVAGQRIGVFATVGGGMDVGASIGPGELRELKAGVTYDPDKAEETLVTGDALFVIPAQAGLRIFVKGGLGAGIPVVSAEAGLEVGGGFGLEGAAEAAVDVDWTPQDGLNLEARGEIYVEPMLRFDVTGYATVEADLVLKTITLYDESWKFKEFEFGSGYRFGIVFPIEYVEGEPFDISLDDIEFDVPTIEPKEILVNVVDQVT